VTEKPNPREPGDDSHRPGAPIGIYGHHGRQCVRPSKGRSSGLAEPDRIQLTLHQNTSALTIPKTMPAPRIPRTIARVKPKPSLRRRGAHLAFVRLLPCVACGKAGHQTPPMCVPEAMAVQDKAGRSLRRSSVRRLSCETASGWRAYLLVRAAHRSGKRSFAVVD
jgi:hypothetical protein